MKYRQASSVRGPATIVILLALGMPITASRAQILATSVQGVNFTTSIQEVSGQTWNDAIWEPGPDVPIAGNTYEVLSGGMIRTPSAGGLQTFPGDSLTLDSGAVIIASGSSDTTLYFPGVNGNPGLILNGGTIQKAHQPGSPTFTIAGQMAVVAPSAIDHSSGAGGFVIAAQLAGSANLTLAAGAYSAPMDVQSTNNPYSGNWLVRTGYLKASGVGSLGTGNITVFPGSTLEIDYNIQTPGVLTLLGTNSVMVLHQDCQFSAVSINGVSLPPGTYTYNNLLAQFPGNFAPGGSGSLTVVPASLVVSGPPPPAPPGYYVDYQGGSDSNVGTNPASAWRHCPGDPAATGVPATTPLQPGGTVFFKGGVKYVLTGDGNPIYQTGIGLNWSGAPGQPITYDGNSAGTWGTGRAILTDNYSSNYIAAFYTYGEVDNLVFNNLEIGPIGGAPSLPPDPGTGVPSNQGYGIFVNGSLNGVTIANCYFHDLGYWYNQAPMDALSVGSSDNRECSAGIETHAAVSLVITNCEFTKVHTAIELAYAGAMSNVTIAASHFHDYMVWCIDLAGENGSLDDLYIHDNLFQDYDWAYSPTYWTGYNYHPQSCSSCFTGPPHQDAIFHRTGTVGSLNGSNIDIYNNTWTGTHSNGVATSCIYLEYAASANIYNNLFNIPLAGIPGNGGGPEPAVEISYELNAPSTVRILNNTAIINTTANAQNTAFLWGACGCLSPSAEWPSDGTLAVENNVVYSFTGSGGGDPTLLTIGVVLNQPGSPLWTVDYNDWHSLDSANDWFWWNNPAPYFNIHGDLSSMQALGFDAHGLTSDPLFANLAFGSGLNAVSNDYHLQSGSPVIGRGANLSGLNLPGLNTDKDGKSRPASGPWDLGAYQH
jgi:hypothetical protein